MQARLMCAVKCTKIRPSHLTYLDNELQIPIIAALSSDKFEDCLSVSTQVMPRLLPEERRKSFKTHLLPLPLFITHRLQNTALHQTRPRPSYTLTTHGSRSPACIVVIHSYDRYRFPTSGTYTTIRHGRG